jgi:hypothetical protein
MIAAQVAAAAILLSSASNHSGIWLIAWEDVITAVLSEFPYPS